jgi:hypothetical protein
MVTAGTLWEWYDFPVFVTVANDHVRRATVKQGIKDLVGIPFRITFVTLKTVKRRVLAPEQGNVLFGIRRVPQFPKVIKFFFLVHLFFF